MVPCEVVGLLRIACHRADEVGEDGVREEGRPENHGVVAGIDPGEREEPWETVALSAHVEIGARGETSDQADRAGKGPACGLVVALVPDGLALREGLAAGIVVGVE